MAEALTRDQFNAAVADAVTGLLNVYREVDAMARELRTALEASAPPLRSWLPGAPLVPGAGRKNPDGKYLRGYRAWFFVPGAPDGDEDDEDAEEDADDEGGDAEDAVSTKKSSLLIPAGSNLAVVSATVFEAGRKDFVPNLAVAVMARCRAAADVPAGTDLKIRRSRLRQVLRAIDQHKGTGTVSTGIPITAGTAKHKHTLVFDLAAPWTRYPLFDVTSALIPEIAGKLHAQATAGTASTTVPV